MDKVIENYIEGRNPVIEAFRSGKVIDKLYILDGCNDGPIMTIKREAKKNKDFAKADAIRDELLTKGIAIKDTREGVVWERV